MWLRSCFWAWSWLAQAAGGGTPPVEAVAPPPSAAARAGLTPVQYVLMAIYLLVCLGLIGLVLSQTSKNEGLSGMIGGSTQSVFRGKKSFEEKLVTATNILAGTFIVLSIILSFVFRV